jgi:hypothetical protein
MRRQDLQRLERPYTDTYEHRASDFSNALDSAVPSADQLVEEITADLDVHSFGVSWWTLPPHERILISDYLYQCCSGIETNLVEAQLHLLEWLDVRDRESDRLADSIQRLGPGRFTINMPRSARGLDDLNRRLDALHICGFFRAVGSSLDCLGAAIIGVLGLNRGLRRSDFGVARSAATAAAQGLPSNSIWADFAAALDEAIRHAGPDDWLPWTLNYRHVLIHRGRPIQPHTLTARDVFLYDHRGDLIPRARIITHLPKYPDRSDVENWLVGIDNKLREDAEATMTGVLESAKQLEIAICTRLVQVWRFRRQSPQVIQQPISQWPVNLRGNGFDGYDSAAAEPGHDEIRAHGILLRRMRAASVFDGFRDLWEGSPWLP